MNCDDAFDLLTNPHAQDDPELTWHLDLCPRCRQMREILSPALSLFEEPVNSNEPTDHAGDSGQPFLSPRAVHVAESTARALSSSQRPKRSRGKWSSGVRYAVTFAAGLLVAGIVFGWAPLPDQRDVHAEPAVSGSICPWQIRDGVQIDEDEPPRSVVLSCVACHLETPPE